MRLSKIMPIFLVLMFFLQNCNESTEQMIVFRINPFTSEGYPIDTTGQIFFECNCYEIDKVEKMSFEFHHITLFTWYTENLSSTFERTLNRNKVYYLDCKSIVNNHDNKYFYEYNNNIAIDSLKNGIITVTFNEIPNDNYPWNFDEYGK